MEENFDTIKLEAKINPNKDHSLFIVAVTIDNDHKYSKPLVYKATTDTTGFRSTSLALVIAGGVLSMSSVAALAVAVKIYCRRDDGVETTEENPKCAFQQIFGLVWRRKQHTMENPYYGDYKNYSQSEVRDTNVEYVMGDPQGWDGAEIKDLNPEYAMV